MHANDHVACLKAIGPEPFEDPWELAAILRAADRRLGRACLLNWMSKMDPEHPALVVIGVRFGTTATTPLPQCETPPWPPSLPSDRQQCRSKGDPAGRTRRT